MVGELTEPRQIRNGRCNSWKLDWHRERFEWEKQLEAQLVDTISRVRWNLEGIDRLMWVGNDQQEYTVKSGYNVLNKEDLMQTFEVFRLVWSIKIAPSAAVCAWRLLLDRVPTRSNLVRRGIQIGNMQCPMCQEDVETTQHLLITCRVTQKVWDLCDKWSGNVAVRHKDVIIHFQSFHILSQRQKVNRVWKGM